jgi:hypothetical protein
MFDTFCADIHIGIILLAAGFVRIHAMHSYHSVFALKDEDGSRARAGMDPE